MIKRSRYLKALVACLLVIFIAGCQSVGSTKPPTSSTASSAADGPPLAVLPAETGVVPVDARSAARNPVKTVAGHAIALPAGLPATDASADTMVAHFIDVGQGDAILLEFSCAAMLIDTGGENTARTSGNERLRVYLDEFFARRPTLARSLSLVVLSHPHADHTSGVPVVLDPDASFTVLNVLDNGPPDSHASGRAGQIALEQYAASVEGIGYVGLAESDITTVSGATSEVIDPIDCRSQNHGVDPKITALWGRVDLNEGWANNANNDSVVLRVEFGKASFLFTGDLQAEGIASMLESYAADLGAFDVDVLKVGHHGSHNATTPEFIAAISPKIAIIQAGESSPDQERFSAYAFGHPNAKALKLLLDPTNGVSMDRLDPIQVRVGLRGRNPSTGASPQFANWTMRKAIYANGWDGNIAVTAKTDGTLSVETGY